MSKIESKKMQNKKGILYLVPTPVGNLQDMTYRAVEVLKNVAFIGAEDTRTSGKLLKHYEIFTRMISYHKFNEQSRVKMILEELAKGNDIAIISDAGTPGISDPSNILVKSAIEGNFIVSALPGATAFVPALVSSGFSTDNFYFAGFLPEKESSRFQKLERIKSIESPLVFYEAPHRLQKFFLQLYEILGNRKISVAREISKKFETIYYTNLKDLVSKSEIKIKGEFVIVVDGNLQKKLSDNEILTELTSLIMSGKSKKDAVKEVCGMTGEAKNKVYRLSLKVSE